MYDLFDFPRRLSRLFILAASFALLILTSQSCVRGEDYDRDPDAVFQSLWRTIDEHYCFLDYKQQAIGLDWNEVYRRYHAQINEKMSTLQLFEVLSNMLSELRDGHVNLYCSADVARNWSWKNDYPENFDTELRNRYLGTDFRIAGGLKYRILEDNIGYMVYESFSSGIGEGNIGDALHFMRACNGLIIDVRNNSGGDLDNAERLASHFTNEERLIGYITHKTGSGHNDFSQPEPEYLQPSNGLRWQKPCIVLTNRSCYSATNAFVRNMKECPLVTIMGDQTGGGSGLPFVSELSNGWTIRFSACPMFDSKMQHIEFGIQPDIPCSLDTEKAHQGIDTIIEEARTELKKEIKKGATRNTQNCQP